MYSIYGRKRNEGGYKRILESHDYFLDNSLPSSDLNTVKGDSPGVVSFIENNMRFIGVVIPHIHGTSSEKRSHCITHIIGEPTSLDNSVWKLFNKETLRFFYHGTEDDVSSCTDSLKPEIIQNKSAMIHHIEDKALDFHQCQRLLRHLRFQPDLTFNIQCEKSIEYALFKFLGDTLEDESISLNLESSCRVSINGHPRTPFFSTLNFGEIPPYDFNISFDTEEFDIREFRIKIYEIYESFHKSEIREASSFLEMQKSEFTTKMMDPDNLKYLYKHKLLGESLLFVAEKDPALTVHLHFSETPSLECLYDFDTVSNILRELPLSVSKKKRVVKDIKKILSVKLNY